MKIITLNHSAGYGGASRAAFRVHEAINKYSDKYRSEYFPAIIHNNNLNVDHHPTKFDKYVGMIKSSIVSKFAAKIVSSEEMMSINLFNSKWPSLVNNISPDIVNLHWVCAEMMSISDIRKFTMPVIWTMHDMWAFSGFSHFPDIANSTAIMSSSNHRKEILERWMIYRKKKLIGQDITFVSPSVWLGEKARQSWLGDFFKIEIIPNPIDLEFWQPINKEFVRELLGVPIHSKILLFGAMNLEIDARKGYDLLFESLKLLSEKDLYIVTFGGTTGKHMIAKMHAKGFGYIQDDLLMRMLYASADMTIIPSRSENLPNMALESLSCGTPVLSFDVGGLSDIIQHKVNGYLASPFDNLDLINGIKFLLNENSKVSSEIARKSVSGYSYEKIGEKYADLYSKVLSS